MREESGKSRKISVQQISKYFTEAHFKSEDFGMLSLVYTILMLPFEIYDTFVIEEQYGFNKTTPKTFIADKIKTLIFL